MVEKISNDANSNYLFNVKDKELNGPGNYNIYNSGTLNAIYTKVDKLFNNAGSSNTFKTHEYDFFERNFKHLFGVKNINANTIEDLDKLINKSDNGKKQAKVIEKNKKISNYVDKLRAIYKTFESIPSLNVSSIINSSDDESAILAGHKDEFKFLLSYFGDKLKGASEYSKSKNGSLIIKTSGIHSIAQYNEAVGSMELKEKSSCVDSSIKGPSVLVDLYDYLYLSKRLTDYRSILSKKENAYAIYIADYVLSSEARIFEGMSKENYYFAMLYILDKLLINQYPVLDRIYIDEYQNYSLEELRLIRKMYPYVAVDLYGDPMQKIEQKGIDDGQELPIKIDKTYSLNVNYRNSREVCEFLNETFGQNIVPIGLKGSVDTINESDVGVISVNENDRTCIIVKDVKEFIKKFGQRYILNNPNETGFISSKEINVMSIDDVKGLEFENVIVDEKDMNINERYLACSRPLNNLYILKR